jgi:hypothetical protein
MTWQWRVAGAIALVTLAFSLEATAKGKKPVANEDDEDAPEPAQAKRRDEGWFVVARAGLVRRSGDSFTLYAEAPPGLPGGLKQDQHDKLIRRMKEVPTFVTAGQESAFTLSAAGIGHPDGKDIKIDVADPPGLIPCCLRIDSEGNPWMLASDALGHREDSGKWKFLKRSDLKVDYGVLRDFTLDANDAPWVVAPSGLRYLEGATWQTFNTTPPTQFVAVAANADAVVALASDNVVRIQKGKMVARFPMDHSWRSEEIAGFAMNDDNDVVVAARSGKILILTEGTTPVNYSAQKDLKATFIRTVATDKRRRFWFSTDNGLAVLADGAFTLYPNGSIPQLAGVITNMAIVGKGPELPAPVDPPKVTVKGRLLDGRSGVERANLVLCPHPSENTRSTNPCQAYKVKYSTVTDDNGNYTFKDVPAGGYGRAWKEANASSWEVISGDNIPVRGTGTVDLGELQLR